jgi:hypothetical protein
MPPESMSLESAPSGGGPLPCRVSAEELKAKARDYADGACPGWRVVRVQILVGEPGVNDECESLLVLSRPPGADPVSPPPCPSSPAGI